MDYTWGKYEGELKEGCRDVALESKPTLVVAYWRGEDASFEMLVHIRDHPTTIPMSHQETVLQAREYT